MDSVNTLKLIDALFAGSNEEQKNKLTGLYKSAFTDSESYKKLKYIFDSCEFYGADGESLQRQVKSIFEESFNDAEGFSSKLSAMDFVVNRAEDERRKTEEYVCSARLDNETLSVVEKSFARQIGDFYSAMMNYICCVYATFYGKEVIRSVNADFTTGALNMVKSLSDELCAADMEINKADKPKLWKITKTHFHGLNAVKYDGFSLEYISGSSEKILDGHERIAPFLYAGKIYEDVLCYGIGKITNLTFRDGAKVLGSEIVEKPALNCLDQYDMDYNRVNILSILNMLFQNKVCIVEPSDIVEVLNRYFMIKAAKKRSSEGKCILCGGGECKHFELPEDYKNKALEDL